MISKEKFKDIILNILLNEKFGNLGVLFNTEDRTQQEGVDLDD